MQAATESQKVCCHCKVLKKAHDFTRDVYNKDKLSPHCRDCARVKLRAARERRRQENAQVTVATLSSLFHHCMAT